MSEPNRPGQSSILLQRSGDCLVVPLPANPDADDIAIFCQSLPGTVRADAPRAVIFDCSEVVLMDSRVAKLLDATARPIRLLGARTILAGLSPGLCSAMVRLELHLPDLDKAGDLDHAFELAAPSPETSA